MDLIDKLKKEQNKLELLSKILNEFPDVKLGSTLWEKDLLYSKSINPIVTNVTFQHGCGCCPGAILYAKFYIERFGIRIYADPIEISIGRDNEYGSGEIIDDDIWDKFKHHKINLNPELKLEIEKFIKENEPIDYADDEED